MYPRPSFNLLRPQSFTVPHMYQTFSYILSFCQKRPFILIYLLPLHPGPWWAVWSFHIRPRPSIGLRCWSLSLPTNVATAAYPTLFVIFFFIFSLWYSPLLEVRICLMTRVWFASAHRVCDIFSANLCVLHGDTAYHASQYGLCIYGVIRGIKDLSQTVWIWSCLTIFKLTIANS